MDYKWIIIPSVLVRCITTTKTCTSEAPTMRSIPWHLVDDGTACDVTQETMGFYRILRENLCQSRFTDLFFCAICLIEFWEID